jgi:hypothetical protein
MTFGKQIVDAGRAVITSGVSVNLLSKTLISLAVKSFAEEVTP